MAPQPPLTYVARGVSKRYGGVTALDDVTVEVRPGEIHALVGANGAGKSTLVKVLAGAVRPDAGTLTLAGREINPASVRAAVDDGIAIVSQELNVFPDLDVLQNLFLLREPLSGPSRLIDRAEMRRRAKPVLEAVGLDVALGRQVGTLRLGEQQLVEIARAMLERPRILILDEPTSALRRHESERLLAVASRLRDDDVAIVYVSHALEDVFAIADVITVLRDGRCVAARTPRAQTSIPETIKRMLGANGTTPGTRHREPDGTASVPGQAQPRRDRPPVVLRGVAVEQRLAPTDLEVAPGEIVGLAGLDGAGPQAVFDVIFGRAAPSAGSVSLPGGDRPPRSMARAVRDGIAYVPADRKGLGVMLDKPIFENVALVRGVALRRLGVVLRRREMVQRADHWRSALGIAAPDAGAHVGTLSGGNQQRVVFAKWLEADPSVVLLEDPCRGVDIGAKRDMHAIVAGMAREGRVVLYISNDLEEMAEWCHRVVVFYQGAVCGEVDGTALTGHRLLEAVNTGKVES